MPDYWRQVYDQAGKLITAGKARGEDAFYMAKQLVDMEITGQ